MKVIERKALTRNVIGRFDLSMPPSLPARGGHKRTKPCTGDRKPSPVVIARSAEGATWQSPKDFGDDHALGPLALRG